MNTEKHTPTVEVHEGQDYIHIYGLGYDHSDNPLAVVPSKKVADLIVCAVNSHEALLDALLMALPYVERALEDMAYTPSTVDRIVKQIKGAIALAEGK